MKYRRSAPNERVWCTTQLAKFCCSHSIGRTHSWRFQFFQSTSFLPWVSWFTCALFHSIQRYCRWLPPRESQEQRWSCATQEYYWLCSVCWFLRTSWSIVAGSKGKPNHSLLLPFLRTVLFVMLYTYSLLNSEPSSNIPIPKGVSSCTGARLSAYLDFGTPPTW